MATRLRGVTWEHDRGYGSVVAAAAAYREAVPDVEVVWEYRSLQAFADQPLETIAREADLIVIDHPHIPEAAAAGYVVALDSGDHDEALATLHSQSVGPSHASYAFNGHQWGLAIDAAAQVAAYRPDLLETPPRNWNEVLDLAREGGVLWPYKPVDAYSSLLTLAAGNGYEPLKVPGSFLPMAAVEEAMDRLAELAALVPADNATDNPIQAADKLSTGDHWVYSPLLFGYTNYSRSGYRPHRIRYVDVPASRRGVRGSLLGGAGIVVSAFSAHRNEAIDHAFWLASARIQKGVYYRGGGQPGNAAAWDSPRLNADCCEFFTGTRATLEGAYQRPQHPRYIPFQNDATHLVHRALVERGSSTELSRRLDTLAAHYLED